MINENQRAKSRILLGPIAPARLIGLALISFVFVCSFARGDAEVPVPKPRPIHLAKPVPQPAILGVLAAFDTHDVVGIPEAHEMKDVDDFILMLVRDPSFPARVNDIVVECGNSLYQPILDRYIAGDDVPFAEVQKVWRNTTQPMCGESGFFEQLFPLVRAINQKTLAARRLRVVAADPPVDWDHVHTLKDLSPFMDRDQSIAAVMEKEVRDKHRKALMLFGIFHLLHGVGPGGSGPDDGDAVTIYEKRYPGRTFVISTLGYYGTGSGAKGQKQASMFGRWPNMSLVRTKGTTLGALSLSDFLPTPLTTDATCNVVDAFADGPHRPVEELIDAFLYLAPQDLNLKEPMPADIALDTAYRTESLRRTTLMGLPGPKTLEAGNAQIVRGGADPILVIPRLPEAKEFYPFIRQSCLDRQGGKTP